LDSTFRINDPPVVAETLDGEATIVDLDRGIYYSLNESGSFVWDELGGGADRAVVAAGLASRYSIPTEEAESAVDSLIDELVEQRLIVPSAEGAAHPSSGGNSHAPSSDGDGQAYSPPVLSTFTDLQDLLLLDPVHEVDESGWPSRA
jgi:Coenzyme PQQ synthesis protein D (PqqD)